VLGVTGVCIRQWTTGEQVKPGSVADHTKRPAGVRSNGGSKEGHVESADLLNEIVQPLLQLGRAVLAHARAHRDTSLAEYAEGVLGAWRVVAPMLLEGVLQVATSGLEDNARPIVARCPGCQQRRSVQSRRRRHVQIRLGPIRLQRPRPSPRHGQRRTVGRTYDTYSYTRALYWLAATSEI